MCCSQNTRILVFWGNPSVLLRSVPPPVFNILGNAFLLAALAADGIHGIATSVVVTICVAAPTQDPEQAKTQCIIKFYFRDVFVCLKGAVGGCCAP